MSDLMSKSKVQVHTYNRLDIKEAASALRERDQILKRRLP